MEGRQRGTTVFLDLEILRVKNNTTISFVENGEIEQNAHQDEQEET